MLVGRVRERRHIEQAVARSRSGSSTTLALVGEPGIGKTTLLDHAAELAAGMQVLRARGIESEAQIPFGSLFELIRPALTVLDKIPVPQAAALEGALALRPGGARDRFAVGAATLSLLASYAEDGPVAVLIDDAHWLDVPSAQSLLFAFRRLLADPICVVITARAGESSLLDEAGLQTLQLGGLTHAEAQQLVPYLAPEVAARLHSATSGNPLGLLELAAAPHDLALAPEGAPVLVSARISRAFLQQLGALDEAAQRALVLAATSDTGDVQTLEAAAARMGADLAGLAPAEAAGLVTVHAGMVQFRHPLARSAIYADAPASNRREAHRALAAALPDRDVVRRAWHLAAAAVGTDETAAAALEQAGISGLDRTAYASAAAAFERAARLTSSGAHQARLLQRAAEATWHAGFTARAVALLDEARTLPSDQETLVAIDELAGHIAVRCGPVMHGHEILTRAADRAAPERAVAMLAEAAFACLYAGDPAGMLAAADRARERQPASASARGQFLLTMTTGTARILGGNAATGAAAVHEAVLLAEATPGLRDDPELIPWLVIGPLFLRQAVAGRQLLGGVLRTARERAAIGGLPFVLTLFARDQAATEQWAVADATYQEAIALARESGQRTGLTFGLAGLAMLQAQRGQEAECRASVAEALDLCAEVGMGLCEIWATAALGELELGLGNPAAAAGHFERQQELLRTHGITDADLSPAPELADAYTRLGRQDEARRVAGDFLTAATAKAQPWPLARAMRCQGLLAADTDYGELFAAALRLHEQTPDAFETARTQLAYGERLRRSRNRILARDQLRAAADAFDHLDARPWAQRARGELAATGETRRQRTPSLVGELTPQELQISELLTEGRTTREAAAALFLSPKTVEYHLRHVYQKLGIHTRDELAEAIAAQDTVKRLDLALMEGPIRSI